MGQRRLAFIAAMEKFLATHIGGRYQESMSEEVAKRLAEISVNVDSVGVSMSEE